MGALTREQAEEHAKKVLEAFADGWQWTDLFDIVPQIMEIVEQVGDMTGAEKQASAEMVADYVIDETDIPWLPDSLIDPILKKAVRKLFPLIVKASKGEVNINKATG